MKKNKRHPLVSIGVLSYNREDLLPQAINSLLAQTYRPIEIIISDDASSDRSPEICTQFAQKHSEIRVYFQKKNIGIPKNSNFLLSKARGMYFMWASNDDTWNKQYVSTLVSLLQTYPHAHLASTNFRLYKTGFIEHTNLEYPEYLEGLSLLQTYLAQPFLFVWGLFRTKSLKLRKFHEDRRPIYGGSDFLTVFYQFLDGGLVFCKKELMHKRDSGNALDRFEILAHKPITQEIFYKIIRYLTYPLLFTFDLIYLAKTILFTSRLRFWEKVSVLSFAVMWYGKTNCFLFSEIMKGLAMYALRILKYSNPYRQSDS